MAIDLGLEEIIEKIVAEAEDIAIEAVVEAGRIAQRDIEAYAKHYMSLYYGEYTPLWYKRTKHLSNSIIPYLSPSTHRGKSINVKAGIVYDSSQLDYKEDGRDKPDSGWVLNNFLQGIHPVYTKTPSVVVPKGVSAARIPGSIWQSPRYHNSSVQGQDQLKLMEQALDKEAEKVADYIAGAFMKGVASRILK